jgi:hypothetical protein
MKVDFVDSCQEEHGVQPIVRALEGTPAAIAPSTYYAAKTRPASARSRRDAELTTLIKQIHAETTASTVPARSGMNCCAAGCGWPGAPPSG